MIQNVQPITMTEHGYLGAVCSKGEWRYFYDTRSRFMWALNLKNADSHSIPQQRMNLLTVHPDNIETYLANFERELTSEQIRTSVSKIALSFVVDFDRKVFIDGMGEEGEYLPS